MVSHATGAAVAHRLAAAGDTVLIIAGMPFGEAGSTNLLHVGRVPPDA